MKLRIALVLFVLAMMPVAAMATAHQNGDSSLDCIACHAVHDANTDVSAPAALWGRDFAEISTGFTMYEVNDVTNYANDRSPTGGSRVCLSCHDGTETAYTYTNISVSSKTLTNMHPISFVYDENLSGYKASATVGSYGPGQAGLDNNRVECTSCHGMHNNQTNLLRESGTALCTTCHDK